MQTTKLKLFIALAEIGHFNRTAQACHVSPSKLSRTIQSVETELGITLFERDNRHVALTTQGEDFLHFAREHVKHWETFQDSLKNTRGALSGTVSIYCSVTASYSFLYEILAKFREQYPLIQIKLHTGDPADAINRVSNGQEDIAIAAKPEKLSNTMSFKQFDASPLIFICSSKDTHYESLIKNLGDAAWQNIPMIVSERGLARERFNAWVASKKIAANIYSQVSGNEAIVSMVSLNCGIGLVPQIVVENSPLKNSVKKFSVQPNIASYEVGACVQSRRLKSPLVNALWQLI